MSEPTVSSTDSQQQPASSLALVRVRFFSEVLGSGVFWEGPPDRIGEIHNIPARDLAIKVLKTAQAGFPVRPVVGGMWVVEPLNDKGEVMGASADKLAVFLRHNAKRVRPGRAIPSPYAAYPAHGAEDLAARSDKPSDSED